MSKRIAAATFLVALGAIAVPATAQAVPAPDPPQPSVQTSGAGPSIRSLQEEYRLATTAHKHALHNEITLLVNVGSAAL
jgi:hypothetical protein